VIALETTDDARLEEILDGTYPIWGEGLTRPAYSAWNRGQMRTEWGRKHLRRLALLDDGTLLASAKRYDFRARVGDEVVEVLGIGAVFTPVALRGQGHARVLINEMTQDAVARGCRYALLFSEIGPDYYAAMGFRPVPRPMVTIAVTPKPGAPATFVRTGTSADLPAIAEITMRYSAAGAFALERTPDLIEFGFARRRLLAGLGPPDLRVAEFFVAEEGHKPVAYVFITRGPAGAVLEECGDRDPGGARIGAILQVLAARAPAEMRATFTGWLPSSLRPPQLVVSDAAPSKEVMMIRSLSDDRSFTSNPAAVVYWQTDTF